MAFSEQEEQIVKKLRKAKRFVFLCQHRHELRDEAFQPDLAGLYRKRTAVARYQSLSAELQVIA